MSSATNLNILQLIRNRELNDHIHTKYTLKSNMDYKCISKLGLFAQLKGHKGSVNCLQWNKSGSTLASVSNDHQIIVWDPFLQKAKTSIKTVHNDSIFSIKFIPGYNDDILATASADQRSLTYNVTTSRKLRSCFCFRGEIRSLAVANDSPSLYWCASGNGYISQHDIRMRHICSIGKLQNTLVKICGNSGSRIGPTCLDINQIRSEQLAVGANDQYVRLYDRRMIKSLSSFYMKQASENALVYDGNNVNNALQYFLPGHIQPKNSETITRTIQGITHLTFSPDGQELLVNYGCEYVYLYDLVNRVDNAFFNIPKVLKVLQNKEVSSTNLIDDQVPVPHLTLPDNVVQLKLKANHLYEKEDYTAAIILYNEAINIHKCSELFLNRAAAYIKRKWHGDFYAALKDCVTALKLEPNHMEAHFQLVVSLFKLNKLTDSKIYLDQFIMKYPSYNTSAAYKCLYSDLLNAQSNNKDTFDGKKILEMSDTTSNVPVWYLTDQTKKKAFEKYFRNQAKDYHCRYIGRNNNFCIHNKEANFFGSRNQFIVAGSDNGLIFVWEKNTEKNLFTLQGDYSAVNCIQPHPSEFLFATSSIGRNVKLWSPLPDDVWDNRNINNYKTSAALNQRTMMSDQF
ncbi:WD and tetratricopeptide repeats protein 1-like [Acyrthosiphon pisum]|uniref:WD and tetratricopeptide repeats protein 1 n=1 Tax=Acyrthosiphon pisum TaxID=7029 RepID=A0A8R2D566_ACYPI|nr:WD and tetratricopeptide repeats protein 1-like [Acyrthosiphon pisum]|eukprot:XP_016661074.1 PREDICTED: WD and tetratricopeptide repeats protein 1-like [Acyrthosiphon pisum]